MFNKLHSIAALLLISMVAAATELGLQGKTRISRYATNTLVESRLATTKITVEFMNEMDCATIRGFTMQLPINGRVTNLVVETSNECKMTSDVKTVLDAQEEFHTQSSAGKPAALLQAWDATQYPVWVSLPPLGKTTIEITFEELLARANYEIPFQIPLSPGQPVDELTMEITVSEPDSGVTSFDIEPLAASRAVVEIAKQGQVSASARLELSNVLLEDDLPRLIRASYDYDPAVMPRGGIVIGSGACVSHLFNPSSLLDTPIPKNIVFVVDTSGSMSGQKLADAKAAFEGIIQTLEDDDYFTVHTFSSEGTEKSWGPSKATSFAKSDASAFVKELDAEGGTNLNDAFLDAIGRAKTIQAMAEEGDYQLVPIIMMLSDGQATEGVTNRVDIARAVRESNDDVNAKIFGLAFGSGADLPLLLGIAIQNQGRAIPIYEGYGDSAEQMEDFYSAELRRVLLHDLTFNIASDVSVDSQTQTSFPVFADGSEVFVRAKPKSEEFFQGSLQIVANAISSSGPQEWIYETSIDDTDHPLVMPFKNRECVQSFAHSKIVELLNFREAYASLGDELNEYAGLISGGDVDTAAAVGRASDLASDIKAYAIDLALDAGLVWPGLTAMVTIENDACAAFFADGNKICSDGDGDGHGDLDGMPMEEDEGAAAHTSMTASDRSSASRHVATNTFGITLLSFATAVLMWVMN
mmetsp:Transcript_9497/g.20162  ORF Transcript_9497/g.20162 Transcript_9497/m.20162 type:complete len:697 (+) Transcript_9497:80-2170(+)